MEITSKRYIHDHVSSYKNRGEKLGCANRFVRAHRANEERKTSRLGELTKRRSLLLSLVNECNLSLEENPGQKKTTVNANDKAKCKGKSKSKENEPQSQATDERKAMLLKWREQRELKRKTDAAKNQQKAVFAVRHIQHDNKKLFMPFPIKKTKASSPKKPKLSSVSSAKSATRSSARLANKQIAIKSETKSRPASNKKETVASKKVEEVPKRVTRQSTKAKTTSLKEKKDEKNLLQEQAGKQNSEVVETEKKATPLTKKKQQQKSFAPSNFQFTGPSGLYSFEYFSKDFKFQPLSPASTDSFFQGITPASATPENCRQLITKSNFMRTDNANSNEKPTPMSEEADESSTTRISLSNKKDVEGRNKKNDEQGSKEMDCEDNQLSSKYFRGLVSSETEKLNFLCEKWEKEMELERDLPEEAKGNIRTAIGQAQLLISQRFKQFCGLIDLSEDETAEKKATMSDLQGFWDMIYFQVEDVHTKMGHLEKQKEKNWIAESKQVKTAGKKTKKKSTTKSAGNKAAKPTGKSKIQEMRAAMRAKMVEKKRQMVAENGENCSFITVLTPVKKTRKSGLAGSVVLTPVRRSLRNAPISKSPGTTCVTPKIISTPKRFGNKSPGLRLTPEALTTTPSANGSVKLVAEKMEDEQESSEAEENKWESLSTGAEVHTSEAVFDKKNEETNTKHTAQDVAFLSAKKRSCLRTSTKKKRKSTRVYFQSPQSCAKSTAGGTTGTLVLTPGVQGNARSTGITFTPVAVSFDSPSVEGSTCSLNAGHTPAMAGSRKGSLRKRASNGTSVRRCSRKHTQATPEEQDMLSSDSATEISSSSVVKGRDATPLPGCLDNELTGRPGSKRRSLRRSCRKSKGSETECFLPEKYILPSTSSEDDCDDDAPETSPVLVPKNLSSEDQALVAVTPSKNSSNRLNQLSLTPATLFQALSINDSPSDATRRDSVFFAPRSSLLDNGLAEENLICFSPVTK